MSGSAINGGGTTAELNGNGRPATGAEYALRVAGLSKTFNQNLGPQNTVVFTRKPLNLPALNGIVTRSTFFSSIARPASPVHPGLQLVKARGTDSKKSRTSDGPIERTVARSPAVSRPSPWSPNS